MATKNVTLTVPVGRPLEAVLELCYAAELPIMLRGSTGVGKSTAVAAIRLGLLLPHGSTHSEQYVGWTGTGDPTVEVIFETEAQRIWRVRKHFGKTGSSVLHESKNGRDFDFRPLHGDYKARWADRVTRHESLLLVLNLRGRLIELPLVWALAERVYRKIAAVLTKRL